MNELVTTTINFNIPLDDHVNFWGNGLTKAGAKITRSERLPDGSILIAYESPNENVLWRYFQGPDGTYGLSYQTRPQTEDSQKVSVWEEILSEAFLIPNPLFK